MSLIQNKITLLILTVGEDKLEKFLADPLWVEKKA